MAKPVPPGSAAVLRTLATLIAVVVILYFGKPIIVPLALAVLLTFVQTPIVIAIERCGLRRVPAVLLTACLVFLLFCGVGWAVGLQVEKLVTDLPTHRDNVQQKIAGLQGSGYGPLAKLLDMIRWGDMSPTAEGKPTGEPAGQVVVVQPRRPSALELLVELVGPALEPLATAGLVMVLVVFMLIGREELRNRLIGLLGRGHLTGATTVLVEAADRVSTFLLNQLLVNAGFGVLFGLGLALIGVPYAFLWGFLAVLLRFVPYVGSWVAVALPLALSFTLFPGWLEPVLVFGLFLLLELVTANVAEPLLIGHRTGVAPIALLLAAAFWAWVWGPIGLVLSTPMTVCLVVLGQHIPRLRFLSLLLGDQPALAPDASYYQRLLARDQAEAAALAGKHGAKHGLEKVHDEVLLPALARARHDSKRADLSPEAEEFILKATRAIAQGLGLPAPRPAAGTGAPGGEPTVVPGELAGADRKAVILGCPAHHAAEELSLQLLAQLLRAEGYHLEVLSARILPSEIEARLEHEKPDLVFIAVLPPGGVAQACRLCKRLKQRAHDVRIIVGYWGRPAQLDKLLIRLRSAGASYVTTSFTQSRSQIRSLVNTAPAAPLPDAGR
jgi:predicted PurR-regulated permease PerM